MGISYSSRFHKRAEAAGILGRTRVQKKRLHLGGAIKGDGIKRVSFSYADDPSYKIGCSNISKLRDHEGNEMRLTFLRQHVGSS